MRVASLTTFRQSPHVFYDWLRPLARISMAAAPNPAHLALAEMERLGFLKAVITQNIDNLHQRAGSRTVLELHGSMNNLVCPQCGRRTPSSDLSDVLMREDILPTCEHCHVILKPEIILYEEMLPVSAWTLAELHCHQCDIMLVIGTSLEVTPAAHLPMTAYQSGAHVIMINLQPTYFDGYADILLRDDAASILPAIVEQLAY